MTARSHLRGHPIYWDEGDEEWRYEDTDEPTADTWEGRPCGHCGEHATPEGHDPCLGTLPGVRNACCGHGDRGEAYVVFEGGFRIAGFIVDATPEAPNGHV